MAEVLVQVFLDEVNLPLLESPTPFAHELELGGLGIIESGHLGEEAVDYEGHLIPSIPNPHPPVLRALGCVASRGIECGPLWVQVGWTAGTESSAPGTKLRAH